jgi:hypothetical protein
MMVSRGAPCKTARRRRPGHPACHERAVHDLAVAMVMRLPAFLLCLLLAACGGGGGSPAGAAAPAAPTAQATSGYQHRALVNQTENVTQDPRFDTDFLSVPRWVPNDPVTSVQRAAAFHGDVGIVLWPNPKLFGFGTLPQFIAAAKAYPNVKYVYVYDELFYEGGAISIGAKEADVTAAARSVQAAGYQSTITIMANVILDPAFRLQAPDAFDVIGIDLYPSALLGTDTGNCSHDANPYTTMLYCSVQKLRSQGFHGQIWYVFQAFAPIGADPALLQSRLQLQRETIANAPSFGITGVIPYGLYWSTAPDEPFVPGHGSSFEPLVDCSGVC